MFVNYGTRWMRAQPFLSQAVAVEGVAEMQRQLTRIFGVNYTIPPVADITDPSVYLEGPLKGVPGTWPHHGGGLAESRRRQRNRRALGFGDAAARQRARKLRSR
jgi:hypothetical protein